MMRVMVCMLALLTACDWDGEVFGDDDDSGTTAAAGCDAGFEALSTSSMVFTGFELNGAVLVPTHVPGKTYADYGLSNCYNPTTGEYRLIFESNQTPLGRFSTRVSDTGNQELTGTDDTFSFEFFAQTTAGGGQTNPSTFPNTSFVSGTWVVNDLDPLQANILGNANASGQFLEVAVNVGAEK